VNNFCKLGLITFVSNVFIPEKNCFPTRDSGQAFEAEASRERQAESIE
jgi:hypothetical protein